MGGLLLDTFAAADPGANLSKIPSGALIVKAGKLRPNPECLDRTATQGFDEILLEVIAVLLYKQFDCLAGLYLITHCRLIQFFPYLPSGRALVRSIYETRNLN
jgi:hypothetical protein